MQRLKHIGILSFAKIMSLIGFVLGLVAGVTYGLAVMLLGLGVGASAEKGGPELVVFGIGGGLVTMIVLPFVYTAASFLFGLIQALVINLVLHASGGLEIRIEQSRLAGPAK